MVILSALGVRQVWELFPCLQSLKISALDDGRHRLAFGA